jgi:hypothetical protein
MPEENQLQENMEAEDVALELDTSLPFPNATLVRLIRGQLKGKIIKGQVKREMNLWLGRLVTKIAKKMNDYPYSYVDYGMFKEAIRPYERLEEIDEERKRLLISLEKIKADCDSLERDIQKKFNLKE